MHITSRVARSLEKKQIVKFKGVWQNIFKFNQTESSSQITQDLSFLFHSINL